jgi:transposase InsO family protein
MTITLIDEAVAQGARRTPACALLGRSARTVERWRGAHAVDVRRGPRTPPANALTTAEREALLALANSAPYRDCSPHALVARLADTGVYLASESTFYRVLRAAAQLTHRGRAAAPVRRATPRQVATGPNQVWSWDITYLRSPVRGVFFYVYLIVDIWSRKIVGARVHATESAAHAAALCTATCQATGCDPAQLVLHADNGGPMKGATMVATLERLGVLPSFSRPGVSNDNPFSEALFRTLKYCPTFPTQPFVDLAAASAWVAAFVPWYNFEHQHRAIRFVTPDERHTGRDIVLLAARHALYATARERTPARWSGATRDWSPITTVRLNPEHDRLTEAQDLAA